VAPQPLSRSAWIAWRRFAEEIELAKIWVGLGRDCLVMAMDLGRGLIGDSELMLWAERR
jgi:hypothetical protein